MQIAFCTALFALTLPFIPIPEMPEKPRTAKIRRADKVKQRARVERNLSSRVESGLQLREIDSAFSSGAVTFAEARDLYREQALLRQALIAELAVEPQHRNLDRLRYMMRTAQGTIARLTWNDEQQLPIATQTADFVLD